MAFVYILKSLSKNITYVGSTTDLERRLKEHNDGKCEFTKRYLPWKILYKEETADLTDARLREQYFKSCAGRKRIKKLF
jgi:putative endonuclease